MASIRTCPDEHELLPVATGEPAVEGIEGIWRAVPTVAIGWSDSGPS